MSEVTTRLFDFESTEVEINHPLRDIKLRDRDTGEVFTMAYEDLERVREFLGMFKTVEVVE